MRKLSALLTITCLALCLGCAVQKSATTLDTETVWRVNTVSQLDQLQRDYRTLFTDVGNAHRSGLLSDSDVAHLNTVGDKLKPAIEQANQSFKTYEALPTTDTKSKVIALVLVAEQIMLDLTTQKAQIMVGGGK